MRVPQLFLFGRQLIEQILGDDVFNTNKTRVRLVTIVDDTLTNVLIDM